MSLLELLILAVLSHHVMCLETKPKLIQSLDEVSKSESPSNELNQSIVERHNRVVTSGGDFDDHLLPNKVDLSFKSMLIWARQLPNQDLNRYALPRTFCPYESQPVRPCDPLYPYRSLDGSCNNLNQASWGRMRSPFRRLLRPAYDDGINEMRKRSNAWNRSPLPNPRQVAIQFHSMSQETSSDSTNLAYLFTEFVHYDLSMISPMMDQSGAPFRCSCDSLDKDNCINIPIPSDDSFNQDQQCFVMARSSSTFSQTDCRLSTREQLNLVTHWLDLSQLYGNSRKQSNQLRLFRNGLLRYSVAEEMKHVYLPFDLENRDHKCSSYIDPRAPCFYTGDARTNLNVASVAFHTIWLREHNRIADGLARINPHWNDERLFQEARKINIAQYQHIVYNEYLPQIVGQQMTSLYELAPSRHGGYFNRYSDKIKPTILNEFTTAAFRFEHVLARSSFGKVDTDNRVISRTKFENVMFKTSNAFRKGGLDSYIRGSLVDTAKRFDPSVNDYMNHHYYQNKIKLRQGGKKQIRFSLPAININRARDHGIPGYNFYRSLCGLNRAQSFNDFWNMPANRRSRLAQIYEHVDDVDLFTGATAEEPTSDGIVGPTLACIIAKQFRDLKFGDRFYYENGDHATRFSRSQLKEIKKVTMAQLLCDNVDMSVLQLNPFRRTDSNFNRRANCMSLNHRTSLKAWQDWQHGHGTNLGHNVNRTSPNL